MKKIIYKIARFLIKLILPIVKTPVMKVTIKEAETEIKALCRERELFSQNNIVNLEINEKIDLSMIIPVYNVEKYLERCLKSVVNQKTKYHFEVIAVNDGSTDSSAEILEKYEKRYDFFQIITQENQGLSGARNTGINQATR